MATIECASDTITSTVVTPKLLPPYAVIVHNDNDHTFLFVVELFQKVLRYSLDKCEALANEVHKQGRAIVWTGSLEVAELKQQSLHNCGPDTYSRRNINYPLHVTIEPVSD